MAMSRGVSEESGGHRYRIGKGFIRKEFSGEVTIKLRGTMESTMGMGKVF